MANFWDDYNNDSQSSVKPKESAGTSKDFWSGYSAPKEAVAAVPPPKPVDTGFWSDQGFGGITKNTITGIPNAVFGGALDYLETPEGQETALNLTWGDVGKSIFPALAAIPGQVISDLTGQDINLKSNFPSIAGDVHIQSIQNTTAQAVQNGENPYVAILKAAPQAIFDGLMVAGVAEKVFSPRESVVATGVKNNDLPSGTKPEVGDKSFRLSRPPTTVSSPVPNEAVMKLQDQIGIKFKNYNPELPTYFRQTSMKGGVIQGEIVQVKPSYFQTFLDKFKGDISKVPPEQTNVVYEKSMTVDELNKNVKSQELKQIVNSVKTTPVPAQKVNPQSTTLSVEQPVAPTVTQPTNPEVQKIADEVRSIPEPVPVVQGEYQPARGATPKQTYANETGSKFIQGIYEGKPYTTDSYILEFNSDVQPPNNKVTIVPPKDAPTEEAIKGIIPKGGEPVYLDNVKTNELGDFVNLKGDTVEAHMQRRFYDYFNRKYPGAEFIVVESNLPIKVIQDGELKGLVMPIYGTPNRAKITWQKTQKQKVAESIKEKPKTIKEIAEETKILEPNVRRILGVGAREGTFERVEKGVYILSKDGQDMAYIQAGDALESLPKLAKEGFKADMIFLDIPYDTPAIKGGNRGMNYNLISVKDFGKVLDSVKEIAKQDNTPVIHMFSQAPSGMKAMQKYNDMFLEKGFIPVGKGELQKTFKTGKLVTNVRGDVSKPEGILVFTQSGKLDKNLENLNFKLVRPKGYQSEKPAEMLKSMIEMTTEEGDVVLDPFAGSGVTGAEAVKSGRKAYLIEKNPEVVENIIKSRIKKAMDEKGVIEAGGEGGSETLASKGAGKIGTFEPVEPLTEGTGEFKLHEEVLKLGKKYNPTVSESKNLPHGAAGVRWGDSGNVATQGLNDLAVMVHESAHSIDTENKITNPLFKPIGFTEDGKPLYSSADKGVRKELTQVYTTYYAGAKATHKLKTRMREGFATLVQKYVETPVQVTQIFPTMVKDFLKPEGRYYNAKVGELIKDAQHISSEYQNLSALDKYGAHVTDTLSESGKKSFLNVADKINENWSDNIAPFTKLGKMTGNYARLLQNYSGNLLSQNIKGTYGSKGIFKKNNAYWRIVDGQPKKTLDYNWNTLDGEIGPDNQTKFGWWLAARDQHFQFIELNRLKTEFETMKQELQENPDLADAPEFMDDFKALKSDYERAKAIQENESTTQKEADAAYEEGRELFDPLGAKFDELVMENIKFLNDPKVGIIDAEQLKVLQKRQGYAPRVRDITNEIMGDTDNPQLIRTGKGKISFLMKRKGSSRAIINPYASAINQYIEGTKKGLKQMLINQLATDTSKAFPDMIQKVTLKPFVNKETGAITFPQEKNPDMIMARINYKRVPYEIDKQISRVINELFTPQNMGAINRTLLFFGRTFTKGTTGIISSFTIKNIPLDQPSAMAQTQTNYIPLYSQIKNLQKIIANKNSPEAGYMEEYLTIVGSDHTSLGIYNKTPEEQMAWLRGEEKGLEKYVGMIEDVVDIATIPTKISEIATRSMEYINARVQGDDILTALDKASTITATFGYKPRLYNNQTLQLVVADIPYFRASLQVLATAARTLGRDAKSRSRFLIVWGAVIGAMVTSLVILMKKGTEEQKNAYKGLYGNDLARNLYYPNADGKTLGRYPISNEMGWLGALINMAIVETMDETDYNSDDYIDAATAFIPQQLNLFNFTQAYASWIPKPFDVGYGLITNRKFYPKTMPLESQSQMRLPPGKRGTEGTSPVAKAIGAKFNLSPIQIDYITTGVLGRAGGIVLGKESYWDFLSPFHQTNYFTSSRLVERYWDAKVKNDQEYTAKGKKDSGYSLEEKQKITHMHTKLASVDELLDKYSKIDIEKEPDKAEAIRSRILNKIEEMKL